MSLAKSYAAALYGAAAEMKLPEPQIVSLEQQMDEMVSVLESSKGARVALTGPATDAREKTALIDQITSKIGASELMKRFLTLLVRKGRLSDLAQIRHAFGMVRFEAAGGVLGTVTTAEPITESEKAELEKVFSKKQGKKVALQTQLEPSLLAGVKVTVSGVTYDGSLRSQIARLRDQLVHGTE